MNLLFKYFIIAVQLQFCLFSFAQKNVDEIKYGLISIAYDNTEFERPFDVIELDDLNSETMIWPRKNNWSLKGKGFFTAPISGKISISADSDNFIQVDINGKTALMTSPDDKQQTYILSVEKGRNYPIEIAYIHDGGNSFLKVYWSWKGKEKTIIPGAVLHHYVTDKDKYIKQLDNYKPSDERIYLDVPNPDQEHIPSIRVWQRREELLVGATFPSVPGLICDSWCYESDLDLANIIALDKGRLKLIHRYKAYPFLYLVTLVTPEPGGLEFLAWIERKAGSKDPLPEKIDPPNLCWQLKRAENFNSGFEVYPEFVTRCFLLTKNGQTFLDKTDRKNIPVRGPDEDVNNPPWVQIYLREDQPEPKYNPDSWAGNSDTRFERNIIGNISKDGKYLTAIANNSAPTMCQAWHDCMHNNPAWLPSDAPVDQRIWRLKIYAMENNTDELMKKVKADFPDEQKVTPEDFHNIKSGASLDSAYLTSGAVQNLPVFTTEAKDRQTFPMSWLSGNYTDFNEWKTEAREVVHSTWQSLPPAVPFNPVVIEEEDRGTYIAQKIVMNITGDSRILTYFLKPKGEGPFPAVLLLHDHGARFDIGKEKVIRPFNNDKTETIQSANEWSNELYGGRFLGDELAKRGYACFATDALNWGDRPGGGAMAQQAIASNMFNLGMSMAGLMAYEDVRAARFLASHPEVDPTHVAAMGLSMGSFRTWQVAAMSDDIMAGVSICWMSTTKGLMSYFNNQTKGHSSYTMTHPGLFNYLDYPDVASLACPKPMLFYNGTLDKLFPVQAVTEAYNKMHLVWNSRGAGNNLITKLWVVPHVFNVAMQEKAFTWLDKIMSK